MHRNCDEEASQVSQGSKKVLPGTALLVIREGNFSKKGDSPGAVPYALEKPQKVLVYLQSSKDTKLPVGKPMSLKDAIETNKIKAVSEVLSFAPTENHNCLHPSGVGRRRVVGNCKIMKSKLAQGYSRNLAQLVTRCRTLWRQGSAPPISKRPQRSTSCPRIAHKII